MQTLNLDAYPTETTFGFPEAQIISITNTGAYPITYNFDASVTSSGNVTLQPGQSSNDTRSCTTLHLLSNNGIQSLQVTMAPELSHQIGNLSKIVLNIETFPRNAGETTDDARISRAIASIPNTGTGYESGGALILFPYGNEYTINTNILVNKTNTTLFGHGATLINNVSSDAMITFNNGTTSIRNSGIGGFRVLNNVRNQNGLIKAKNCLGFSAKNLRFYMNSFGSPGIVLRDCYNAEVDMISGEAQGSAPLIIVDSDLLNVSTINIKNVFAQAGLAVAIGTVSKDATAQLMETINLTNVHCLMATGTTSRAVFSALNAGVSPAATSIALPTGQGANFTAGDFVLIGDDNKTEWNLIQSINVDTLTLTFPLLATHGSGERVGSGHWGIFVGGINTYSVKINSPHLEILGVAIDLHGARGVTIDTPFITGQIIGNVTRGIRLDPARYVKIINAAYYNLDTGLEITNKVSSAWGTTTGYVDVDGFETIGTVTNPVVNNSGNNLAKEIDSSGNFSIGGNTALYGNLAIGGGTVITKRQRAYTAFAFGTLAANSTTQQSYSLTGVANGDDVTFTPDAGNPVPAGLVFYTRVTSANTVTVTCANVTTGSIVVGTISGSINHWKN